MNLKKYLFPFVLLFILTGCVSLDNHNHPPLAAIPFMPKEGEVVVYLISPKGYFAPYEFYQFDFGDSKYQLYFGSYSYLVTTSNHLNFSYHFDSRSTGDYGTVKEDSLRTKHVSDLNQKKVLFLLRKRGEFFWIDQSAALKAMAGLKYRDFSNKDTKKTP
jgi:hypothetical protein